MSLSEHFMETFRKYLKKHGKRILSIAELTGQKKVKIGLKGLYWYYEEYSPDYPKLEHLVKAIIRSREEMSRLNSLGIKFVKMNNELYVELSVDKLKEIVHGVSK